MSDEVEWNTSENRNYFRKLFHTKTKNWSFLPGCGWHHNSALVGCDLVISEEEKEFEDTLRGCSIMSGALKIIRFEIDREGG